MTAADNAAHQAIAEGRTALGIELGSTRIKAVLIGADHAPMAVGAHSWENQFVDRRWTYSLDAVWAGVQDCYASLAADVQQRYGVQLTTVGALGVIIGARISDTLVSHWGLYALGYRPNPGLKSTPLYVLEAVFIALTFWKGLSLAPGAAWTGIAVGAVVFVLVLPVMRAFRAIRPSSARAPWIRWQPPPAWTKE